MSLLGSELLLSALHDGLDLHSVAGVSDEVRQLLAETNFSEVVGGIEVAPELGLEVLSGERADLNFVHADGSHDAVGSGELLAGGDVGSEAGLGEDEGRDGKVSAGRSEELSGGSDILSGDGAISNGGLDLLLESMLSEVMPESLEVGLGGDLSAHLMRVQEVFLLDDLGSKRVDILPDGLILGAALLGVGVNAEDDVSVLVGVSERVELGLEVIDVTLMANPVDGRLLVEEQSGRGALAPLLESEPLGNVGLETLTTELHGGGLLVEVHKGVLPSGTGVSINLPAISLLGGGPVGHLETLEERAGLSVEGNISDSLEKGIGMEVLGVHVMHVVRLLVELVDVEVLDTDAYSNL